MSRQRRIPIPKPPTRRPMVATVGLVLAAVAAYVCLCTVPLGLVEDLQDPSASDLATTGATETADRLDVHSLHERSIGWIPRGSSDSSRGERP